MPEVTTVYRREKLYEQIWTEPMRDVAKVYGVSDVALANACRKLNVPRPSRGYWAQKAAGHDVRPRSLPPLKAGESAEYKVTKWVWPPDPPPTPAELEIRARPECQPQPVTTPFEIHVSERLTRAHPLVASTWADLRRGNADWNGICSGGHSDGIGVKVSARQIARAMRILDALVRGVERAGYEVLPSDWNQKLSARFRVDGVELKFRMRERIEKSNEPPTEDEKKWSFLRRQRMRPTGELVLTIESEYPCSSTTEWKDLPDRPVEGRINEVFKGILVAASETTAKQAEWKALAELRAAEERKKEAAAAAVAAARREAEAVRRREEQWAEALVAQAHQWQSASVVRRFIEAVRAAAGNPAPGDPLDLWLSRARQVASALDPVPALLASPRVPNFGGIETEDS